MSFKKLMVPVDDSDYSMRALESAMEMASFLGAEILLVHCHKAFPSSLGEPYLQKVINKVLKASSALLDPYRERLQAAHMSFDERILEGSAGKIIPEVARIEKADLIIMGSRGRTDLGGLILGSVTHRVLHAAACPVMVIR
jgi:nucleotide-binding universal stress UspA family protein